MAIDPVVGEPVQITIQYEHSKMIEVFTNCPLIDHFLRKVKVPI